MHKNYNMAQALQRGTQRQTEHTRADMHARPSQRENVSFETLRALLQPGVNEEWHKRGKIPPHIEISQSRDCLTLEGKVLVTRAEVFDDTYRATAVPRIQRMAREIDG